MSKSRMVVDGRRLTRRQQRIYDVFVRYPGYRFRSLDVARMARCWGVIYPELAALERMGMVASDWQQFPHARCRVYWLVDGGQERPFRRIASFPFNHG